MLLHYLKIAYRHLMRNKVFSYINIAGLSIGMAAALIIFQYVYFEYNYDQFHEKKDRIYRVDACWDKSENGGRRAGYLSSNSMYAIYKAHEDHAEIEDRVSIRTVVGGGIGDLSGEGKFVTVKVDYEGFESIFKETEFIVSTPSLFNIFSFELIKGERENALMEPRTLVISASTAKKYFGNSDAMGRLIEVNNQLMKVTGIFRDLPASSSLQFDLALSMNTYLPEIPSGDGTWAINFILLRENADAGILTEKMVADKMALYPFEYNLFLESQDLNLFSVLRPLTSLHLMNENVYEVFPTNSKTKLNLLLAIGLLILTIAWINYVNMITARSVGRIKEVGIRRVAGAGRFQLVAQFFGESLVFNLISIILAITISQLLLPYLSMAGMAFGSGSLLEDAVFWIICISIFAVGCFISSFYPAWVISSYQVKAIFARGTGSSKGRQTRLALIGAQFAASIGLIIITFVIASQLNHLLNKDLGFDKKQVMVIPAPFIQDENFNSNKESLKNKLLALSGVVDVTGSYSVPSYGGTGFYGHISLDASLNTLYDLGGNGGVDYNFADFFGLKILEGRNFMKGHPADEKAVLVSKLAAERMGYSPEELVGKAVYTYRPGDVKDPEDQKATVIGVYEDYYLSSLHRTIGRGSLLTLNSHLISVPYKCISVKFHASDASSLIQEIDKIYSETFPDSVFDYFFLDQNLQNQYTADMQFRNMVSAFSVLAIIISVIGLYGLVSITAIQKTKEIGIRKVLGARLRDIFKTISKDFVRLYVVAVVVILPVTWYFAAQWLENYASRISLSAEVFILPALALFVVVLLTISLRIWKVSRINPSESLRYE